jgi:transposase
VFIDETGFWVGMAREVGRSVVGKRVFGFREHYRGQKLTLVGAIKKGEVMATQLIENSMKGDDFRQFVQTQLVPKLTPGDVVIMDNLRAHHRAEIQELIEGAGGKVEYLPVYSPEFNPIEIMWSQLKSFVRKFATRSSDSLNKLINLAISLIHR